MRCLIFFVSLVGVCLIGNANAQSLHDEDFSGGDGGYTVTNGIGAGNPAGPWTFAGTSWSADGGLGVVNSFLDSPTITVTAGGPVTLGFDHRYNFEYDGSTRWDAGQVRLSVNGATFAPVEASAFTANGYATDQVIGGNSPPLTGQFAFNGTSAGFGIGEFITSEADLGSFSLGDEIVLRFIGSWDEGFLQTPAPNWEINAVRVNGTISEPTTVLLDIKPGSSPNSVNLKSKGVLPVAILGTAVFDVNDVDITTLMFGDPKLINNAVSPLRSALEDVSGDGFLDLSLKFSMVDLVGNGALGPDTLDGILIGLLVDGTSITGMDSIRIVPPKGSNANSLQVSAVPEPSTLALTALGLLGMGWCRRKQA